MPFSLSKICTRLEDMDYQAATNNNPAVHVYRSPHHPAQYVAVPMNHGDELDEAVVRHILRDELIDVEEFLRSL